MNLYNDKDFFSNNLLKRDLHQVNCNKTTNMNVTSLKDRVICEYFFYKMNFVTHQRMQSSMID